jgi:hypothetical protein
VSSTAGGGLRGVLRLRRAHGVTLASGIALVAGLIAGAVGIAAASGAAGTRAVRVDLGYACRFPSATYQVSAVVAATFPTSAATGTPIQPTGLTVTVTLPQDAVSYLRGLGAASVRASGSLATTATSAGTPVPAQWPVSTAAAASLPDTGSLRLGTAGTAPPSSASAAGTVTFGVSGLALTLSPTTSGGGATNPAAVAATCAPSSGSSTQLAAITVSAGSASPSPSAKPSAKPPAKHRSRFPKGCGDIKVVGTGVAVCGYLVGYSDVLKLYGATRLGPALVNIDFAYRHGFGHGGLIEYSKGQLDYKGKQQLPPVRSTFLGFGFVPVTATLTLLERGPINIVSVSGITAPPYPISVTATTRVAIHVSDVAVNGVPLAVGAGCRAAYSAKLTLVGHGTNTFPPTGYTLPTGGPLSGFLTIPPFVHCGVTQNLDVLLTGSISGPGNYVKMTQGKLCGPSQPSNWTCPPPIPKPIR